MQKGLNGPKKGLKIKSFHGLKFKLKYLSVSSLARLCTVQWASSIDFEKHF
jgi:hypothetical protein